LNRRIAAQCLIGIGNYRKRLAGIAKNAAGKPGVLGVEGMDLAHRRARNITLPPP
jgi:hypothetical protein